MLDAERGTFSDLIFAASSLPARLISRIRASRRVARLQKRAVCCATDFLTPVASHENNFVTYLQIIDLAHVDHHQIHGYSANERATLAAHQDGGTAIGKVPWVAIGITGRQCCDPHFLRSDKRATVTNGAPFWHVAH